MMDDGDGDGDGRRVGRHPLHPELRALREVAGIDGKGKAQTGQQSARMANGGHQNLRQFSTEDGKRGYM